MEEIFSLTILASFITFAFVACMTPGPNNLMLLSSGLTFGYKKTLPHILGIALGYPIMFLIIGLGLGKIFEQYPIMLEVLKYIGMSYLLWMAWHIANTKGTLNQNNSNDKPFTFLQAVLFQWVNPKAWIMSVTSLATFLSTTHDAFTQIILMTLITILIGIITTHSWSLGGVFLKKIITNENNILLFNRSVAVILVCSIIPFI